MTNKAREVLEVRPVISERKKEGEEEEGGGGVEEKNRELTVKKVWSETKV